MGWDPVVMFFVLGLAAGLARTELKLPAALYDTLTILLLLGIGLHGGVELAAEASPSLLGKTLAVMILGCALPLIGFPLLRLLQFSRIDAANIAAHYGSVSAGTFAVAIAYMLARELHFESYMPLFVVVLEVPAIIVGILLAKGIQRNTQWRALAHEVFLGKSIVLLLGGLCIGVLAGEQAITPLKPLYTSMFKPVLALFLLEMGLIAARQFGALRQTGFRLVLFALIFPLIGAALGGALGHVLGLSVAGTAILATLSASGSYIAVPAAMRMALPEANPALSLTASLGITFPFNILLGIPVYLSYAEWLAGR